MNSVLDLVGNTPLVKLAEGHRRRDAARARQGRVPQPRRLGEGPDRDADGRGGRGVRRAAARRHDRRADLRQHRRRAGDGGAGQGLPLRLRLPGQGQRGQAQRAQGVRRRGGRLPDRRRARAPGLLLQRLRPADPRDRGRLEARPVLQPEQPALPLRDHRPGDLGADRRQDHPLRRRRRHRRHDQRHRPLPQGAEPRRPGRRRRPGRARSTPAAPAGPTSSRGSARTSGPTTYDRDDRRPDHRGLRRRLVRDDPPAGPRGGAAGRRLLRDGGVRGDPARPGARRHARGARTP